MATVFKMQFRDATRVTEEIWQRQDAKGEEHSAYGFVADSSDTRLTPDDEQGEELLRVVLQELDIKFEE